MANTATRPTIEGETVEGFAERTARESRRMTPQQKLKARRRFGELLDKLSGDDEAPPSSDELGAIIDEVRAERRAHSAGHGRR